MSADGGPILAASRLGSISARSGGVAPLFSPESWPKLTAFLMAFAFGLLGRMMYHVKEVQRGERHPLSWELLWELPVALGMGVICLGIAHHLGLEGAPAAALIAAGGYLGPRVIDAAAEAVKETIRRGGNGRG